MSFLFRTSLLVPLLPCLFALACNSDAGPSSGTSWGTHVDDWRDEIIYELVTDRFADGNPHNNALEGAHVDPSDLSHHQGGDFQGILEHLDYLRELGVTALWISPIVANTVKNGSAEGYHGYWASDFTRVNPRFGTLDELRTLVREAHARKLKVILDVVINHAGPVFFYDLNANGKQDDGEAQPPYLAKGYDAVHFVGAKPSVWLHQSDGKLATLSLDVSDFHHRGVPQNWASQEQILFGDFPSGLRDLATDQRHVMDALVDTYAEWVRLSDVDGFRLDAAPHVSHADWAHFCTGLRARLSAFGKQQFMLLGEVYRSTPDELASYTSDGQLDAVFDFTFKFDAIDHYLLEGGPPLLAREALEAARASYPGAGESNGLGLSPWQARVVFGDNHDMSRMLGRLDDTRALSLALTLLFTVDGIPSLYYGTEQNLKGQGGHASREPLWKAGFSQKTPTFERIRTLIALRKQHEVLRRGDLLVRYAASVGGRGTSLTNMTEQPGDPYEGQDPEPDPSAGEPVKAADLPEDSGILAYERVLERARMLVVLNATANKDSRARMATGFAEGSELHDLLGSGLKVRVGHGGEVDVTVARRSAVLLTD